METKNLNTKYCVGLGEILFDVLPSGSQLGGAPANFAYHAGQHGLHSVAVSAVGKDALGETALRILDEKKLKYVMPEVDYPYRYSSGAARQGGRSYLRYQAGCSLG